MKKWIIPVLLCLVLLAGCVSSQGQPVPTPAPTAPPATIPPAETTPQVIATTTPPATQQTTPAPSKPLASTVTLSGVGSGMQPFTTVAPGKVLISWQYSETLGKVPFCKVEGFSGKLSGASIDATLFGTGTNKGKTGSATFNLISPGTYKIAVTGCYGWKVTVSNA